jgi:hypothetical protein
MPEFRFLDEQRGLYDAQTEQVEAWKAAHDEAMQCREIEDAIQLGLIILANISRHNNQWARDIENSLSEFSWDTAARFAVMYRWWREKSESLIKGIAACEKAGFLVSGSADFREACREVDLMSLDTERTRISIESLGRRSGISLKQAMNGLRVSAPISEIRG